MTSWRARTRSEPTHGERAARLPSGGFLNPAREVLGPRYQNVSFTERQSGLHPIRAKQRSLLELFAYSQHTRTPILSTPVPSSRLLPVACSSCHVQLTFIVEDRSDPLMMQVWICPVCSGSHDVVFIRKIRQVMRRIEPRPQGLSPKL